ncbi:MAG: antitoxin Xre/MbcA/ParS toxin-binding domain-containing protein [Lautropia sp.]
MNTDTLSYPVDQIAAERSGLTAAGVKALASELRWPEALMLKAIGLPTSSWTRKKGRDSRVDGAPGFAALTLQGLLERAREVVEATVAPDDAADFDVGQWLGEWLQTPMAALQGKRPVDMLDVPAGQAVVFRLLGSLESGAYQ